MKKKLIAYNDELEMAVQGYADLFCGGNFSYASRELINKGLTEFQQKHKHNPHGLYALYLKGSEWKESATVKNSDLER